MPPAAVEVAISSRPSPPKIPLRSGFAQHFFVGGNAFMVELLKSHVDELELTCSTDNLDDTLDRVLYQLQNTTLDLSLSDAEVGGDALGLTIRLENLAGHKFPAGFPARRAWIHIRVEDANGQVVFESGRPQVHGTILGCDADESAAEFERHYDVISDPAEVQIYESVIQDMKGKVTYTLLQAADYVKDNRLLPRGFDKESADDTFAVKGLAAVDENFVGGMDEVTYQMSTKGYEGPFEVAVDVLYQSIAHGFIRDLEQYDLPLVQQFLGYFEAADKAPVIVASLRQTVK
jgi:hypothetical protein